MALRNCPYWPLYGSWGASFFAVGGTSRNISAGTHWVGTSFVAPQTGTIATVHFRTGTVSSPVCTLECAVTALDANGFPLGTDVAAGDAVTNPAASTNYSATVSASVTAGNYYGLIVRVKSGSITGSVNILASVSADWGSVLSYPFNYLGANYNIGSNTKGAAISFVAPKYSTGWVASPYYHAPRTGAVSVATGATSGYVAGNKFTLYHHVKVAGYFAYADPDAHNFELYSGSDNTAITGSSAAITSAYRAATTNDGGIIVLLGTPIILEPGTYRVGMRNTSTTSSNVYRVTDLPDSAAADLFSVVSGGWQQSMYTGSWADTNTNLLAITPLISAIDDGTPMPAYQLGM